MKRIGKILKIGVTKTPPRGCYDKFRDPQTKKGSERDYRKFSGSLKHRIDFRNLRNIEKLIASICIKRSLRLKDLSQVFSLTEGDPARRYLNRLSYLSSEARFNERGMSSKASDEALFCLKRDEAIKFVQGKAVVIIDPTYYYKRNREK